MVRIHPMGVIHHPMVITNTLVLWDERLIRYHCFPGESLQNPLTVTILLTTPGTESSHGHLYCVTFSERRSTHNCEDTTSNVYNYNRDFKQIRGC